MKVNCAALPTELLESELFGYERGAFTGAIQHKPGKFEFANHGTMFLDEIGEMSFPLQAKLLQVLQDGEFSRLGGKHDVRVDVRVVAATNRDLEQAVADGQFREDLFFRLNVVAINLPPLRERREDIPLLTEHFLKKYSVQYNKPYRRASARGRCGLFMEHDWPGNIRELENLIKRAVVLGARRDHPQGTTHAVAMSAHRAAHRRPASAVGGTADAARPARRGADRRAGPRPVAAAPASPAARTIAEPSSHVAAADGRQLLAEGHLPRGGTPGRARTDRRDAPADALEPKRNRGDPRHQLQGPPLQDQRKRPRQGFISDDQQFVLRRRVAFADAGRVRVRARQRAEARRALAELPDAGDARDQP